MTHIKISSFVSLIILSIALTSCSNKPPVVEKPKQVREIEYVNTAQELVKIIKTSKEPIMVTILIPDGELTTFVLTETIKELALERPEARYIIIVPVTNELIGVAKALGAQTLPFVAFIKDEKLIVSFNSIMTKEFYSRIISYCL